MTFLNKQCACEYGKKCWMLGAVFIACGLFIGVLIGYAFIVVSAEKLQHGYEIAEQVRRGEITDVATAQEQMTGKRVKVGGFLSETKNALIRAGQACKDGIDWVFGAPPNADIKKSTLLMSGQ